MAEIMTVRGPVDPAALGITLSHEHLFIDLNLPGRFDYPMPLDDPALVATDLATFRSLGGTCVVDATLPAIGRDPVRLEALSSETGLAIVMGAGWYRAPYYPVGDRIERRSVSDLADHLVDEIEHGVVDTGIRPGVLGEIGVHGGWIEPIEERVHRAVAHAQIRTGLPILQHSCVRDVGLLQLRLFTEEGVDPSRVAVGHVDSYPSMSYWRAILEAGAYLSLDGLGMRPWGDFEDLLLGMVVELVGLGFGDRILLSQDVCKPPHLAAFGGPGYSHVLTSAVPRLISLGLDAAAAHRLVSDNARRWLTIQGARS